MKQTVPELATLTALPAIEIQRRALVFINIFVTATASGCDHEPAPGNADEAEGAEPADVRGLRNARGFAVRQLLDWAPRSNRPGSSPVWTPSSKGTVPAFTGAR